LQKMRVMQWLMCLMLIIGLALPNVASAHADGEHVKVRVLGLNGLYFEQHVKVAAGSYKNTAGDQVKMEKPTAMGALVELAKAYNFGYEAQTSAYGAYVTQIAGLEAKAINQNTGWSVYVNGQTPQVSADQVEIHDGDVVTWSYVDFMKTLYPKVTLSTTTPQVGEEITVTVKADKTTYDEKFNATTETIPVEGATVFWVHGAGGTDAPMPTTDKNGEVTIQPEQAGLLTIAVYKDGEKGVAELINSGELRLLVGNAHADFQDLNGYGWAASSISQLAAKGIVSATGDFFGPGQSVSREELAEWLALTGDLDLGGNATFSDVVGPQNDSLYIRTAARLGYMNGDAEGTFRPEANLKREEFAIVLTRFAGVEVTEATNATELKFSDNAKISTWALPYVKAAVASGLIVGDAEGTFRPQATLSRAEVATALAKVMNKQSK